MTAALISASAVMFIIFMMALPFDIKSHTAASLGRFFVVENLNFLGVVSLAFSITIENGHLMFNGKPIRNNKNNREVKRKPNLQKSLLKGFDFLSVDVRGSFGNASSAAATAMISSMIITAFDLIKNTNLIKTRKFNVDFTPIYQKNIFDIDLKIRIRVNVFIIILTLLKILPKR